MRTPPFTYSKSKEKQIAAAMILVYVITGIVWIVASDIAVRYLWKNEIFGIGIGKGIAYVAISSLLFAMILRKYMYSLWSSRVALMDSEAKFRGLFQHAHDGMFIMSLDRGGMFEIMDVNETLCRQLEISRVELLSDRRRGPAGYADVIGRIREDLLGQGASKLEWEMKSRSGRSFLYEISAKRLMFGNTEAVLCIFRDITERKRSEKMLRHMSRFDPLTNLPNIRLFEETFQHELEQARISRSLLAIVVLDIDRFRAINDTLGRSSGDKLLRAAASRIQGLIRSTDLLTRMDGDDFKLLLPHLTHTSEVEEIAQKLHQAFEESFVIGGRDIHVTVHIGVSMYPNDGEDMDTLFRCANFAMYKAMENRSAYQLFDPGMTPQAGERTIIESDLKRALLQEQFEMHYQPQLDLVTGRIVGMEALIRWRHPHKGLVAPGVFIPLAEETGMIIPLGEWVLRNVCRKHKEWRDEGLSPPPVAVNLSIRQFMQQNILDVVREELQLNRMPPESLVLEITESMTMNAERATEILREFKKIGVRIDLDDFGTGYSSLNYLKRFPLDKIKIDRSFVRDMLTDESDASIVSTIISLAHHLGLKVIAEGVESQDQSAFLQSQRCDEVQGYYYSPPVPEADFRELLLRSEKPAEGA